MTSQLPAGHYRNMTDAIKNLQAAHEARLAAIRDAATAAERTREAGLRKLLAEQALKRPPA